MKVILIFLVPMTILLFTTEFWYVGVFLCIIMYKICEDDKEWDNTVPDSTFMHPVKQGLQWSSVQIRRLYNEGRQKLPWMRKL